MRLYLAAALALLNILPVFAGGSWPAGVPRPSSPQSWEKHGIVLTPELPEEGKAIQNFNSPAEPLGGGRWRIWYSVNDEEHGYPMNLCVAEGVPGQKMEKHLAHLSLGQAPDGPFSIGHLPESWRPVQPSHIFLKDGRQRLYFWVHPEKSKSGGAGPGVLRLLAADSADGRHYEVVNALTPCLYHVKDRAVEFVGTTPWGLRVAPRADKDRPARMAGEPAASTDLITNDSVSVYQLEDGTFELYVAGSLSVAAGDPRRESQLHDNMQGYVRVIDRLVSEDGLRWHGRARVLQPDADDPIDLQFYYLNVTHTAKGRVGMLGHYRLFAQTMDIEWCFSKDGIHWDRPARNKSWLKRSQPYEGPDSLGLYTASSLVQEGGKWWLFYTAANYTHNHAVSYGPPRSVVMLATAKSIWGD